MGYTSNGKSKNFDKPKDHHKNLAGGNKISIVGGVNYAKRISDMVLADYSSGGAYFKNPTVMTHGTGKRKKK
jgi:hypothetical protein